jgi:hypothetical protein
MIRPFDAVREKLRAEALGTDILSNDNVILAIEQLVALGDTSSLADLQTVEAGLTWEGPIGDGMESIAFQFQRYRNAVKAMADLAARTKAASKD